MTARFPRLLSAQEAAALVPDDATVTLSANGGGMLEAGVVLAAVRERFDTTGSPRGLTLVHALGSGDKGTRGTNTFAAAGMTKRVIGGHWTWSPAMMRLAAENAIEAYALPAGVIALLLREIGARRPGLVTRTGLGTFADPRNGGGRFNDAAVEDLVELLPLDGVEYLRYRPFPVGVAIIRGDTLDSGGNLSTAKEAGQLDVLAAATAARASGGIVIAQVGRVIDTPLDPHLVHVPGALIDAVVVAPDQWQTYESPFEADFCESGSSSVQPVFTDPVRTLIALRAAREVRQGSVVNVGFGVSSLVVDVLAQQGLLDGITLAIEQGMVGGVPVSGDLFGAARRPDAVFASTTQFDLFGSGVLDICAMGMAQADASGNVNVSRIDGRVVGPGGFVDIAQNARSAVFCGTFTAGGFRATVHDAGLTIDREGRLQKFVGQVDQITHSGRLAAAEQRPATYVTERAVFSLTAEGMELVEIAPGIDLQRDVLDLMGFTPIMRDVRTMDPALFAEAVALTAASADHDLAAEVVR